MDGIHQLTPSLTFQRTGQMLKKIPPAYEVILTDNGIATTRFLEMDEIDALFARHGLVYTTTRF